MHSLVTSFVSIIILPPGFHFLLQGYLITRNYHVNIHIFTFRLKTMPFWQVQGAGLFQNGWIISRNSFIAWRVWITNALCSIKVVTNKLGFPCMGTFKSKELNQQSLLKFMHNLQSPLHYMPTTFAAPALWRSGRISINIRERLEDDAQNSLTSSRKYSLSTCK